MYASLISAGASQLYNLLQGQTQPSGSSSDVSSPSTSTSTSASSSKTGVAASSFDTDLNKLFLDLQSSNGTGATSSTGATSTDPTATDPTSTVAKDLQNAFNDLQKAGAGHGHHHHHHGSGASSSQSAQTGPAPPTSSTSNPFQNLASSLLAYANTQGLTSTQSSSTSLTA